MMARTHAALASAGWLGGVLLARRNGIELGDQEAIVGAAVAAGAAVAPDIDHPGATMSKHVPLVDDVARAVFRVKHRMATHSLLACGVVAAGALLLASWPWALGALAGFLCFVGAGLLVRRTAVAVGLGVLVGVTIATSTGVAWWASAAIAGGYALHLPGDWLTPSGIPLLLPVSEQRFSLGVLKTDGLLERAALVGFLALDVWLAMKVGVL